MPRDSLFNVNFWRGVYDRLKYVPDKSVNECLLEPLPLSSNPVARQLFHDGWPVDLILLLNVCEHPDADRRGSDRQRALRLQPTRAQVLWAHYVLLQRSVRAYEQQKFLRRYRENFQSNAVSHQLSGLLFFPSTHFLGVNAPRFA